MFQKCFKFTKQILYGMFVSCKLFLHKIFRMPHIKGLVFPLFVFICLENMILAICRVSLKKWDQSFGLVLRPQIKKVSNQAKNMFQSVKSNLNQCQPSNTSKRALTTNPTFLETPCKQHRKDSNFKQNYNSNFYVNSENSDETEVYRTR